MPEKPLNYSKNCKSLKRKKGSEACCEKKDTKGILGVWDTRILGGTCPGEVGKDLWLTKPSPKAVPCSARARDP